MERDGLKRRLGSLTLANQLTFLRLVAVPFLILAVLDARFGLAFWIFAAAALFPSSICAACSAISRASGMNST